MRDRIATIQWMFFHILRDSRYTEKKMELVFVNSDKMKKTLREA